VDFAARRPHLIEPCASSFDRLFQAPYLPMTLPGTRETVLKPARNYAEILRRLEFDRPLVVRRQIETWRSLIDLARPDLLVADYSPGAALAARGQVRAVAFGSPFCVPFGVNGRYPPFNPDLPDHVEYEIATLMSVNAALDGLGEPPVEDLPSAFTPATRFPTGFTELDPYAEFRTEERAPPVVPPCSAEPGAGNDVVTFLPKALKNDPVVVATLMGLGRPVRVDDRELDQESCDFLERAGARVDAQLAEADDMARSAAVVLSHGGYHTVTRALLAGVPQVIIPTDVEKQFHARVLERLGVGLTLERRALTVPALREAISTVIENPSYAGCARALAPDFRRRHGGGNAIEVIAGRIAALVAA
jgi:UDP:flavonoid glycosyltransferase YjiC (YdhE family)